MGHATDYLTFETPNRRDHVNSTGRVQVVLPVTGGRLDLGPWEQVLYAEFEGRRHKRVALKAIGG